MSAGKLTIDLKITKFLKWVSPEFLTLERQTACYLFWTIYTSTSIIWLAIIHYRSRYSCYKAAAAEWKQLNFLSASESYHVRWMYDSSLDNSAWGMNVKCTTHTQSDSYPIAIIYLISTRQVCVVNIIMQIEHVPVYVAFRGLRNWKSNRTDNIHCTLCEFMLYANALRQSSNLHSIHSKVINVTWTRQAFTMQMLTSQPSKHLTAHYLCRCDYVHTAQLSWVVRPFLKVIIYAKNAINNGHPKALRQFHMLFIHNDHCTFTKYNLCIWNVNRQVQQCKGYFKAIEKFGMMPLDTLYRCKA